ncbi:hypothetical protein ACOSQ4_029631 [Xanthoceras sorbifolium]
MVGTQNADSGCFSGILRRLLCQGSLQTHPSDQIPELNRADFDEPKKEPATQAKIQTPGAPGVVARLMGLESLPEPNWIPTGKAPDSVTRSRSVNFMDYLLKFDLSQATLHRRVRTSVSFREVPTPLHQQNNDLFVMYLDGVDEKKQMGSKVRKSGVEIGDLKQKEEKSKKNTRERLVVKKKESQEKSKRVSKFIDEPRRVSVKKHSKINNSCKGAKDLGAVLPSKKPFNRESGAILKKRSPVKPIRQKEALSRSKVTEKIKELEAAECSSENSSPVSVLDVSDFSIYDDTPFSEKDPRYMDLNSKWEASVKAVDSDYPSPNSTHILRNDDIESRLIKKKKYQSMDIQNTDYYSELAAKLCWFTEKAIMQSNWMPKKVLNFKDFEEICMEFGEHILATLLHQVVEELAGFNVENSAF